MKLHVINCLFLKSGDVDSSEDNVMRLTVLDKI